MEIVKEKLIELIYEKIINEGMNLRDSIEYILNLKENESTEINNS